MSKKDKKLVLILLLLAIFLTVIPLFVRKGSEFSGIDDEGSQVVKAISKGYEPWFTPVIERILGRELSGEMESLVFCIQTGIGVGVTAFTLGKLVERRKWMKENKDASCG